LAKQELDTCKTNLAKLPRWKKAQNFTRFRQKGYRNPTLLMDLMD
jgi:hypothetical protein